MRECNGKYLHLAASIWVRAGMRDRVRGHEEPIEHIHAVVVDIAHAVRTEKKPTQLLADLHDVWLVAVDPKLTRTPTPRP